MGSSLVEEDKLELATKLEKLAKEKGVKLLLPTDVVVADKFDPNANTQVVKADAIPDGWMVRLGGKRGIPAGRGWRVDDLWVAHV